MGPGVLDGHAGIMTNDTLNSATGSGDTTVSPNSATLGFVQPAETPAQKPTGQNPGQNGRREPQPPFSHR